MKKRIFHKVLIPALVVMLMTPFCFSVVKADATNQQILDMLTSIRSQIVYILQTQRIGSTGNYDTIDYLQKMDTNLLELDTHLTEIMADMTAAWDQTDPIQTDNYFESILNYFKAFYDGIGSSSTHLYYIRGNTASMVTALNNISSDLDHISSKIDELVTLVSNIDSTVDTISWIDIGTFMGKTTDFVNFTDEDSNSFYISNGEIAAFKVNVDGNWVNQFIMKITFNGSFSPSLDLHLVYYRNGTQFDLDDYVIFMRNNSTTITYYLQPQWNNNLRPSFPWGECYFGLKNNSSQTAIVRPSWSNNKLSVLFDDDIEYFTILNYFNSFNNWASQLKKSDTIISKLDTLINGNSSSDTIVNQNNDLNQQLQTSVTQYDQIENQFKESFSTNMNQISKPDLSNIVSAAAWYTTQLTSLFNASGSFQIIYVLPLVLGIALFFIGRGAVAFRQSSNQETRWVETVKDENGFTTRHGTIRSETIRRKGRYK